MLKRKIKNIICRYYWVVFMGIFVGLTISFILEGILWLQAPRLLDIIWNDTLHMFEPVYMPAPVVMIEQTPWTGLSLVPLSFLGAWFNQPFEIVILYGVLYLWSGIWVTGHIPAPVL